MPRQPRLIVVGYPHHIILRGNNRSAIFHNDKDRRFFIEYLKEAKEKTKSKIYAYCFMTNHVHLLLEPSVVEGIGKMMQSLGRNYVRYINRTYRRTGTLWEGRFKSNLVGKDEYLLACARYIELNPVRAKMAGEPKDYLWSSFRFRAEGSPDQLLDEDPVYKGLGKTLSERQLNYKEWFKRSIPQEELDLIRNAVQKGGIFGSKVFFDKVAKLVGRSVVLRSRGRPRKSLCPLSPLLSPFTTLSINKFGCPNGELRKLLRTNRLKSKLLGKFGKVMCLRSCCRNCSLI